MNEISKIKVDYSKLEGKEITYVTDNGKSISAIVIGFDPDVGITIMSKDKRTYLVCLKLPINQNYHSTKKEHLYSIFNFIIERIEVGTLYYNPLVDYMNRLGIYNVEEASAEHCAFT